MATKNIKMDWLNEGSRFTSQVNTAGLATSLVVSSTGGGILVGGMVTNTSASGLYLQIHEAVALPSDGAVPYFSLYVPAETTLALPIPLTLEAGCVLAGSTTAATLTIATAVLSIVAQFLS